MHIDQPSLILASRWKTTKKFKSRAAFLASSCSVPSWADGGEHQRIFWISLYIELLKGTHCWWDLAQNSATEQPGNSAAGIWQSMVKNLQFKTQVESKNVQMRDHSAGLQIKLKDLNVLRFLIHLDSFEATQIYQTLSNHKKQLVFPGSSRWRSKDLKAEIECSSGISCIEQKLVCCGEDLEDEWLLGSLIPADADAMEVDMRLGWLW